MTGGEQRTYIQASARTARYSTRPVRTGPEDGSSERAGGTNTLGAPFGLIHTVCDSLINIGNIGHSDILPLFLISIF